MKETTLYVGTGLKTAQGPTFGEKLPQLQKQFKVEQEGVLRKLKKAGIIAGVSTLVATGILAIANVDNPKAPKVMPENDSMKSGKFSLKGVSADISAKVSSILDELNRINTANRRENSNDNMPADNMGIHKKSPTGVASIPQDIETQEIQMLYTIDIGNGCEVDIDYKDSGDFFSGYIYFVKDGITIGEVGFVNNFNENDNDNNYLYGHEHEDIIVYSNTDKEIKRLLADIIITKEAPTESSKSKLREIFFDEKPSKGEVNKDSRQSFQANPKRAPKTIGQANDFSRKQPRNFQKRKA